MKYNYMFKDQAIEAYPDGWSCINCGTEFTEKTIDSNCFYVIESEHGTECLKCSTEPKSA